MKRFLAALIAVLAASAARAGTPIVFDYDVDSLSYYYPILCTPPSNAPCPGDGYSDARRITTSGAASTTVTAVSSNAAFDLAAVGSLITFTPSGTTTAVARQITAKASSNSITISGAAVNIAAAGVPFRLWNLNAGTGAASDGWFPASATISFNFLVDITQISVTGGIDYKLECRHIYPGGGVSSPYPVVATTNKTAVSVSTGGWALSGTAQGPWDQCRVGLKIGTSDDDGVLITATTDNIDYKEYIDSYTTTNSNNDIDFTEDPAGTPKVCTISATNATYTGAALATHLTTLMNAAACTPDNTYLVSYSTSTHKFTIARATGTKAVSLLWATGANTATSAKTLMGYTNADDTGGTSYASDSATGESAEKNAVVAADQYVSGTTACVAVAAAMQAQATSGTYACAYNTTTDKITISATGITQLMILWASGTNNATAADTALGFAADVVGALSYEGVALGSDAANEIEKVTVSIAGYK